MPVFEHQYQIGIGGPDGKERKIPPQASLHQVGPFLQVTISPTKQHIDALTKKEQQIPQPVAGLALIDTGATNTAVDESVCRRLGISPTGMMKVAHAGGSEQRACYPVEISFPGSALPPISIPRALSVNLQFGKSPYVLLFGRDLLASLRFVYNGPMGRIEIAI